ncbi:MAG TPA: protein phosphatase 2C domain-containing protein, partial [Ktedonobacteraceae bacterium]
LPQLPHLWASQGSAIVVPLVGLVLLSLSLLILWLLLIFAAYRVVLYWWHHLHEHEHFAMDLREAERIADDAVSGHGVEEDEYERWQPAAPTLPAQAIRPEPVRTRQPSYVGMRGSRVVGSSGLIRVPSAVFSDDTPFPGPAPSQPVEPRSAPVRPAARVPLEPRTMPMSVPTQAMPRVAVEPRMQLPQSMQATQPNLRQGVRRTALLAPSSVPGPITMREQLHIVPRIIDESDTIPIVPATRDIAVRDTLPDNDLVEIDEVDDGDVEGDIEEEMSLPESQDTLTDMDVSVPVEPLRLLVGIGLDAGIARKDAPNEDNLFAIQGMRPTSTGPEPVGLFIVADGMGGHAHGQEASKLAVQAISDDIVPTLMRQVDNDEVFSDLLKDGVHRANLAIYRRNREQEHMMGTTLTAVLVVARTAYVVNVGDSRTYLYRAGEGLEQVTHDHSVVARLMEDGVISREDIYTHPKRNQIYRCLGEHASVEVDTFVRTLQADDVLVLCSDGLWEMVHDDEMESIVASSNAYPSQLSKMLIQAALMRGGADNISVIVACMAQTDAG